MDSHSQHIDDFVSFVKSDMNNLQSIKETPQEMHNYIKESKKLL